MKSQLDVIQKSAGPLSPGRQRKIDLFFENREKLLSKSSPDEGVQEFFNGISSSLSKAAVTFSVYGEEFPRDEIPRNASMVCGPSYTSANYPQPIDSKGCAMYPVLQIDMEWLGSITNRKFPNSILQLWWSTGDLDGVIVLIPNSDIDLESALPIVVPIEASESVERWIAYDWLCDERVDAYIITDCHGVGVTYPFDSFLEMYDEYVSEETVGKEAIELLMGFSGGDAYYTPKLSEKKFLFNIFGYYKSHAYSPSDGGSEMCFLHSPDWCSGMMDANIFMNIDQNGVGGNFHFSYGR